MPSFGQAGRVAPMKPYTPAGKLVVRDSLDDEYSDDVEDDVFIRDGKSKLSAEENGLKRPLMAPRRGGAAGGPNKKPSKPNPLRLRCWRCCEPFFYGCVALTVLIGVIVFASMLLTMFPMPLQQLQVWVNNRTAAAAAASAAASARQQAATDEGPLIDAGGLFYGEEIPCTLMRAQQLWSSAFARLISESPVRKFDVNGDGTPDVVFGYGLDDSYDYDMYSDMPPRCDTEGDDYRICDGGVLALDGRDGSELWRRWTKFNVFSLLCSEDLNGDGRVDCVAGGRGGLLMALDGRNGSLLWNLDSNNGFRNIFEVPIDLYTVNVIRDLNQDGCVDIIAVHVEERNSARTGHIKVISGRDGRLLRQIPSPFDEEVFVPAQVLTQHDGTECLLITTGGQNSPGGLYLFRVATLMTGTPTMPIDSFAIIHRQPTSGFMVPPVLSDLNGDGIADIVVAAFNATVRAFDGRTYKTLWSHTFAASETVSSLVPGLYDNDNVTDFLVKYNAGPGFPVYYYSQTQVLNGRTGEPLLDAAILDSGGPYSLLGGLSVGQSLGGDHFLHWQTQCGHLAPGTEAYTFIPDSNVVSQTRADTCRLRHNVSTQLNLHMMSRHEQQPGPLLFSTDGWQVQLNRTVFKIATSAIGRLAIKHPKMQKTVGLAAITKEVVQRSENNEQILAGDGRYDMSPSMPVPKYNVDLEPMIGQYGGHRVRPQPVPMSDIVHTYTLPEYDSYFNFDADGRVPLAMRDRYSAPTARDVRSKTNRRIDAAATTAEGAATVDMRPAAEEVFDPVQQAPPPPPPPLPEPKPDGGGGGAERPRDYGAPRVEHRNTLWDLEIEREMSEAKKAQRGADVDFQTKTGVRRRRRARRDVAAEEALPEQASPPPPTGEPLVTEYLPSVASTGVLLPPLVEPNRTTESNGKSSSSSVDFVFVLNVRESETFPALLLPEDLACVERHLAEEKATNGGDFNDIKLRILEQKFMTICLQKRIVFNPPGGNPLPLESQLVVTRLTIECGCGDVPMKAGEVCSRLNPLDRQRWTGFMGDTQNGLY